MFGFRKRLDEQSQEIEKLKVSMLMPLGYTVALSAIVVSILQEIGRAK
jgi:hypothetical protein